MQTPIKTLFMRGGTLRDRFFNEADLSVDVAARDRILLAVMCSPDKRQIDGLGGAPPLTSKVGVQGQKTTLRVLTLNTGMQCGITVEMSDEWVNYEGGAHINGAPGCSATIAIAVGSVCPELLPTDKICDGNRRRADEGEPEDLGRKSGRRIRR